ncbi:MAG: hypothetical protein RL223_344 [Pseudomonadota bacterium]
MSPHPGAPGPDARGRTGPAATGADRPAPRATPSAHRPTGPVPPATQPTTPHRRLPPISREARDTLVQLAVAGLIAAPLLPELPPWVGALFGVLLAWRGLRAWRDRPLPPRWAAAGLTLAATAGIALQHGTLLGREAGLSLLVLLLALKLLELRARRDAMVLFFLGFFIVQMQALYGQSLARALGMLAGCTALLVLLVLAQRPQGRPPLRQALRTVLRSLTVALPLAALVFLVFPRLGPLWGTPQAGVGRTGLSEELAPGDVAALAEDDGVALRLRFAPGPQPAPGTLYFRGPVLSSFDGERWRVAWSARLRPASALRVAADAPAGPPVGDPVGNPGSAPAGPAAGAPGTAQAGLLLEDRPLRYEALFEPQRLAALPLLELSPPLPGAAFGPATDAEGWLGRDAVWHRAQPNRERLRLELLAWPRWRLDPTLDADSAARLRALPAGSNPQAQAWARALRTRLGASADADRLAQALVAHLRGGGYRYSTQPGRYGPQMVDELWFGRRIGFCEHYAAAVALMLRAMDVPARIVTGYLGSDAPDADGWRVVRQRNAHAWVEYWQAGRGWQRLDPTAAVAPERVARDSVAAATPGLLGQALLDLDPALWRLLQRQWATLDTRWVLWLDGWNRQQQLDTLRRLGLDTPDTTTLWRALALVISVPALLGALWLLRRPRRAGNAWERQRDALVQALRDRGIEATASDTPARWADALRQRHGAAAAEAAARLDALQRLRYAPGGRDRLTPGEWRALRRALRLCR